MLQRLVTIMSCLALFALAPIARADEQTAPPVPAVELVAPAVEIAVPAALPPVPVVIELPHRAVGEPCRTRASCPLRSSCRAHVCVDEREGESCETAADCGGGLACVANVCMTSVQPSTSVRRREDWMRMRLSWVHPFVGMALAGGPVVMKGARGAFDMLSPGGLWSIRMGVLVGRNEIGLEVSPLTYAPFLGMGPSLQVNVSYGYLITLHDEGAVSVHWPLRAGVGVFAYNALGLVFLQSRAEVLGVIVRIGHVLLEVHAPSIRQAVTSVSGESLHLLAFHFGGGVTYAF